MSWLNSLLGNVEAKALFCTLADKETLAESEKLAMSRGRHWSTQSARGKRRETLRHTG